MTRVELFEKVSNLDDLAIDIEPESPEKALMFWRQAECLLDRYLVCNANDLDALYLLAYVCYMIWARSGEDRIWNKAQISASRCISSNPNPLAKFYLICLYFEKGDWKSMKNIEFSDPERNQLLSIGQDWRILKVAEMRFAASIQCGKISCDALQLAKSLSDAYGSVMNPEFLVPITAGNALESILSQMNEHGMSEDFIEICQYIKKCSIVSESFDIMIVRFPLLANIWK